MSTDIQGPPLSIFGNKFHSHFFLGTGQKVPEKKGASTAEHASSCPPTCGEVPTPDRLAGPGIPCTQVYGGNSLEQTVAAMEGTVTSSRDRHTALQSFIDFQTSWAQDRSISSNLYP